MKEENIMQPNYAARKSILPAFTFWRVILFFLIVPLIILIYNIIALKKEVIEFYDDKIVCKKGVFNKSETTAAFMGVYAVNIEQSFFGRIFNYGDVRVDAAGKWDIDSNGIKNPKGLKAYLEQHTVKSENTVKMING